MNIIRLFDYLITKKKILYDNFVVAVVVSTEILCTVGGLTCANKSTSNRSYS